jgi:hypothetical protein
VLDPVIFRFELAVVLVGSGITPGNLVLLVFLALSPEVDMVDVADTLLRPRPSG